MKDKPEVTKAVTGPDLKKQGAGGFEQAEKDEPRGGEPAKPEKESQ